MALSRSKDKRIKLFFSIYGRNKTWMWRTTGVAGRKSETWISLENSKENNKTKSLQDWSYKLISKTLLQLLRKELIVIKNDKLYKFYEAI